MSERFGFSDARRELLAQKERLQNGLPTVVKIGGSIQQERHTTLAAIAFLHKEIGAPLVVIHGGGIEIDLALQERNIIPQKIDGLRVTDSAVLAVVVDVLDGVNQQLVATFRANGVDAVGFSATSGLLAGATENARLGLVGRVSSVQTDQLRSVIGKNAIPVITPIAIAVDNEHQLLNINADTAAGEVANALGADLILVTDVAGVLDREGSLLPRITFDQFKEMKEEGTIVKGMIPKLAAAFRVHQSGGNTVICSNQDLLHGFLDTSRGTKIV